MTGLRARWDEPVCDRAVMAFGIWTLLANVTVLSGGSLDQLILCAGFALVLAAGLAIVRRKTPAPASAIERPTSERAPLWMRGLQLAVLAAGAAIAFQLVPARRLDELWQVAVGVLLVLTILELAATRGSLGPTRDSASAAEPEPGWWSAALFGLSLTAVVATLVFHRPAATH